MSNGPIMVIAMIFTLTNESVVFIDISSSEIRGYSRVVNDSKGNF